MSTIEGSTPVPESSKSAGTLIAGVVAATLIATGIGALTLGVLTTLAEASTGIKDFLQFNDRVGPLSGKTVLAAVAYFTSFAVLGVVWKDKQLALRAVLVAAAVLVALGLLGTFPPFFQAFA